MTSIVAGGIVATIVVIVIGVIVSIQPFFQPPKGQATLLVISIVSDENMPTWCENVAKLLNDGKINAAVFFSGKVAQENPGCVTSFNEHIDIGSSTYGYEKLTEVTDYSTQLSEVTAGKKAVDEAGNLDSRSFRAPYGATDENIYSLLSRSEIVADFSYKDRYHKFHDGQFIWFEITVIDLTSSDEKISDIEFPKDRPIQVNIDNTVPIEDVESAILQLKEKNAEFLNASELTGLELTIRREV
ncbi:MAG TPA: polysaccharide deacetylase family protein [Nitrososphaera sp.]|nr:polysaccharide deacetylase family protein [Nitrososphaera sp.]